MLLAIFKAVFDVTKRFKKARAEGKLTGWHSAVHSTSQAISFKSESNQQYKAKRAPKVQDLLARASDWELRFDLAAPKYGQHKRPQFPIEVVEASRIPDGVIWSTSAKTVIWIALTCPHLSMGGEHDNMAL